MKALIALMIVGLLAGCSVNVIVAPHAALTIDSANESADSTQAFHARTVEVLP